MPSSEIGCEVTRAAFRCVPTAVEEYRRAEGARTDVLYMSLNQSDNVLSPQVGGIVWLVPPDPPAVRRVRVVSHREARRRASQLAAYLRHAEGTRTYYNNNISSCIHI